MISVSIESIECETNSSNVPEKQFESNCAGWCQAPPIAEVFPGDGERESLMPNEESANYCLLIKLAQGTGGGQRLRCGSVAAATTMEIAQIGESDFPMSNECQSGWARGEAKVSLVRYWILSWME